MTQRTIAVVSAGLSQPSSTRLLADRLSAATLKALRDRDVDARGTVIELRDHGHDLTNNLLTGFASQLLREAIDEVVDADGLIAVSPIFSASYNGLFKTFFDVLDDDAVAGKPTLIAATAGTARHSLALEHALRPLFAYLKALVVPTAVFAASEDWGASWESQDAAVHDPALADRIDRAAGELADLVAGRRAASPADPFENPVPFERLLGGS